jgi:DNA-binding transcriptional ArsR family regulator
VPAFLTSPTEPGEGLEASLDRLMALSPAQVESDIADYASAFPARREAILGAWRAPLDTLSALRVAFLAAWQRGFAAAWPAIEAVHQGDLMYRSLALTRSGPAELLEDLRPAAWLEGNELCVPATYAARYAPGGAGLVLVTSVFAPDELLTGTVRWGRWVVVHPPVGRAMLWLHDPLVPPSAQLSQLIGAVRAQILTALEIPRTTGDIAELCRLAPNTTSYHLSRLRDAGMVASSRAGRRSYYRLAARGARFLSLWRERSAA